MGNESRAEFNRRHFLRGGLALGALSTLRAPAQEALSSVSTDDRAFWVQTLVKISAPVLQALSARKLKERMPVEAPHGNQAERLPFTHLEAMGRLLCGIAPWLETGPQDGEEGKHRAQMAEWSRAALQSATDPSSPDFMNFCQGAQPLVDTAFLALSIVRAPGTLWHTLDRTTQSNVIAALESSRKIKPGYNNWLLFSAMVEAALAFMGASWDQVRVDYAIRTINSWYKGDGLYGDGPTLHWDYYNSFVIHPLLLYTLDVVSQFSPAWDSFRAPAMERARRYAAIQERLIAPDGTFPPTGRSLAYRFGAFHLLADIALRRQLPEGVAPEQVRCALSAVIRKMIDAPGTFDSQGWLTIGFCGHQPEIAESYISTGSLYLCSTALLPLGLPASDPFWSGPSQAWTAQRAWQGGPVAPDHALTGGSS